MSVAFSLVTRVLGIHSGHKCALHSCHKSEKVTDACKDAAQRGSAAVAYVDFGLKREDAQLVCLHNQTSWCLQIVAEGVHKIVDMGILLQDTSPTNDQKKVVVKELAQQGGHMSLEGPCNRFLTTRFTQE